MSKRPPSAAPVRMIPRGGMAAIAAISGSAASTSIAPPVLTSQSIDETQKSSTGTPRAASSPSGTGAGAAGRAGNVRVTVPTDLSAVSSRVHRSAAAVSRPLREENRIAVPASSSPSCTSTWAAAQVACPQRVTSTCGVNHRISQPSFIRERNAVSERFISRATSCIHASVTGWSVIQTPAGLPAKGREVYASTMKYLPAIWA